MQFNQEQALKLLKEYSDIEIKNIISDEEKQDLKDALLFIANLSDAQNLGICGSNKTEAFNSLKIYLKALGYDYDIPIESSSYENTGIYIKFSTERMSYTTDQYLGEYRGVLVTIFADHNEKIEGTYGYLPLNLFD